MSIIAEAEWMVHTFQVVKDKRTNKSKGYGFVSFKDPNDFTTAMKEMHGTT